MYTQVAEFSEKAKSFKEVIQNESQTRTVLIEPLLKILGYDTSNPFEVIAEYTCDVGTKKGEKVDYAIMQDNEVVVLIEAKDCRSKLTNKNIGQLFRYFSVSSSSLALLTNGLDYMFFTDTIKQNVMDTEPFYQFNILDITEAEVETLKMFTNGNINAETIRSFAIKSKFHRAFVEYFKTQTKSPSNDFVSFITKSIGLSNINSTDATNLVASSLENMFENGLETKIACSNIVVEVEQEEEQAEETQEVVKKPARKFRENHDKISGLVSLEELTKENTFRTRPTKMIIGEETIEVRNWSDSLVKILYHVISIGKTIEEIDLIDETEEEGKGWIRKDNVNMRRPEQLPNGLFVNVHGDAWQTITRINTVVEKMGLDKNDILLEI